MSPTNSCPHTTANTDGVCDECRGTVAVEPAAPLTQTQIMKRWDDVLGSVGYARNDAGQTFPAAPQPQKPKAITHDLKTWPQFYAAVADGSKPFEARENDRQFNVGDTLNLREWDPATREYTGRSTQRRVSYVLQGGAFGIERGHCIMGLAALTHRDADVGREELQQLIADTMYASFSGEIGRVNFEGPYGTAEQVLAAILAKFHVAKKG